MSHQEAGLEAERLQEVSRIYRRAMGLALDRRTYRAAVERDLVRPQLNTAGAMVVEENGTVLPDLALAKMLRCRVRYFADKAVIVSQEFANEAFAGFRERFSIKRKDGVRVMKGRGSSAMGVLWSLRQLQTRIGSFT